MDAKDAIARLKNDLTALRDGGQLAVPIEALKSYIARLELDPADSLEEKKLELQKTLAHFDATNKLNLELFRSAGEAGKEALSASLLINGGAVVAILGFLGAVVSKGSASALGFPLSTPLLAFGSGVLFSALAFGARYLTIFVQNVDRNEYVSLLNAIAILLAVAAYAAFSIGVYSAYLAFHTYFLAAP